MSDDAVHPLGLWGKIKAGVKGFVKSALHYLPRGLLIAGAMLGASTLLVEAFPALDSFFHTSSLHTVGDVAHRIGLTMLIGGAISGGVGAWKGVSAAKKENEAALAAQADLLQRGRSIGPERQRAVEYTDPVVPSGIPSKTTELLAHTASHFIH